MAGMENFSGKMYCMIVKLEFFALKLIYFIYLVFYVKPSTLLPIL